MWEGLDSNKVADCHETKTNHIVHVAGKRFWVTIFQTFWAAWVKKGPSVFTRLINVLKTLFYADFERCDMRVRDTILVYCEMLKQKVQQKWRHFFAL